MEPPTLDAPTVSKIHLIGGEKGGVGKSMLARLLAQYFIDRGLPFVAFDTDRSHQTLARFYGGQTSPALADRYEALDRIIESALETPGRRVLVDLAAQTHEPLVRWMDESGVLDMADLSGLALHYWHVMDGGRESVDLLGKLLDRFGQRMRYVLVLNQLRGEDFGQLERSGLPGRARDLGATTITLRRLHDAVVAKIDACSCSFEAARNQSGHSGGLAGNGPGLGLMERQRLNLWLAHAAGEIARVEP
jgi:hypothetical protein